MTKLLVRGKYHTFSSILSCAFIEIFGYYAVEWFGLHVGQGQNVVYTS